jgi:hypothetical protein
MKGADAAAYKCLLFTLRPCGLISVSATNASLLVYQGSSSTARLEWFDRSGNPLGTLGEVAEYSSPKISPDGKQVLARVVNPQTGTDELWSFPISGGVSTRLTM